LPSNATERPAQDTGQRLRSVDPRELRARPDFEEEEAVDPIGTCPLGFRSYMEHGSLLHPLAYSLSDLSAIAQHAVLARGEATKTETVFQFFGDRREA